MSHTATPQPPPTPGTTRIVDLVMADLAQRAETGRIKYGTYLQAHNGRIALIDAYQEALDLCMYLRQVIEEQKEQISSSDSQLRGPGLSQESEAPSLGKENQANGKTEFQS